MQAGKSLERCKLSLKGDAVGSSEDQTYTIEIVLMRFQRKMRTQWGKHSSVLSQVCNEIRRTLKNEGNREAKLATSLISYL